MVVAGEGTAAHPCGSGSADVVAGLKIPRSVWSV